MQQYRKKPAVVSAEQFFPKQVPWPGGVYAAIESRTGYRLGPIEVEPGDWIITGSAGEKSACKPEIFAASYDQVVAGEESAEAVARATS